MPRPVSTHSVSQQESKQTTTTDTTIQKDQAGFLKFLGIGVTDDNTTETQVTQSSATSSQQTQAISNTINLFAGPNERYVVEVYCDVVFGTFAYRPVGSLPTPILGGTVKGKNGKAAAVLTPP